MLVIFQQWVKSHLLHFWFLHTALEQLPTVYSCDKGHSLAVPKRRKGSSYTEHRAGSAQSCGCWTSSEEGHTKLGSQHTGIQISVAHDRTTTWLQPSWGNNQGHGPELKDRSLIKGEPQQDSQLFPSSLSQDYMAAPYPRWLSTGSQTNCWRMGYLWPWHLLSYKYLLFLLLVMQIPVSATAANKILTFLFPIHKTNIIFKNQLHLFFQLCCFGKAVSNPDNKAVYSSGCTGESFWSGMTSELVENFLFILKHYILQTLQVQKVLWNLIQK